MPAIWQAIPEIWRSIMPLIPAADIQFSLCLNQAFYNILLPLFINKILKYVFLETDGVLAEQVHLLGGHVHRQLGTDRECWSNPFHPRIRFP